MSAMVTLSLWHRLHTLTAAPRSTQPSTLRATVKVFKLHSTKLWWCTWFVGRQSPNIRSAFIKWTGKLSQWLCHDNISIFIMKVLLYMYYHHHYITTDSLD